MNTANLPHRQRASLVTLFARLTVAAVLLFGAAQVAHGVFLKSREAVSTALIESAWHRVLDGDATARPWPWSDQWPVARLRVPATRRSAIVLSPAPRSGLRNGPVLTALTPHPGGPSSTIAPVSNIVVAGNDRRFTFLKELNLGGRVEIETRAGRDIYRVTTVRQVRHTARQLFVETWGRILRSSFSNPPLMAHQTAGIGSSAGAVRSRPPEF